MYSFVMLFCAFFGECDWQIARRKLTLEVIPVTLKESYKT